VYEPDTGTERKWYGWQTLTTDGAALTMISLAALDSRSSANTDLLIGSLLSYSLGGPLVHAAHEHAGKVVGSLALRLGLPFGGAALGTMIGQPCRGEVGCLGEAIVGGFLGIGAAIAIDASMLAYDDVPRSPRALSATPFVAMDRKSATAGVVGSF
jgi:hypothetical protein